MSLPSRVALLDVSVLVALFNPGHDHHEAAHDWFADNQGSGWATCPLTENGLLRVLGNSKRAGQFMALPDLTGYLRRFCEAAEHQFWPDDVSLRDQHLFNMDVIRGHQQLTDVYLLALAAKRRGRLATFDQHVPL